MDSQFRGSDHQGKGILAAEVEGNGLVYPQSGQKDGYECKRVLFILQTRTPAYGIESSTVSMTLPLNYLN